MRIQPSIRKRGGATTVEFSFVAIILFLMLFGIFEYGRFLFVYHMTVNAARDAARFAVVRTNGGITLTEADGTVISEPTTITDTHVQNVWQYGTYTGVATDRAYGTGMCGMANNITGWTFNVWAIPDSALYANPQDLDPTGKPAWANAAFHQQIAVRITGTYQPVVPNLIGLSSSIPFTVIVLMSSEAN